MFNLSKKAHAAVDVKKSIQKILDTKKDSATRLKHLRIILENVDLIEAKYIFETHYSHIYYLFYDVFAATEAGVKLKPHRVHREDVESVLYILEHILLLLPELLQQRWQLHSITRVMRSLLHPGNILRLRREAMRMFIIWFQEVGEQSSEELLAIFATLVPGFPPPASQQSAPRPQRPPPDNKHGAARAGPGGVVGPVEVSVILPPQGAEKAPDDLTRFFLECLMDNMVTQLTRIEWKDKTCHVRCFNFLFDNFKQFYLPHIFPDFNWHTNLYKPVLTLPELRRQRSPMASSADGAPRPADRLVPCRVVVIRWVANFAHASLARKAEHSPAPAGSHGPHSGSGSGDDASQGTPESRRSLPPSGGGDYDAPASLHSLASDSSGGAALCLVESRERDYRDESALVRDVLFGSRQNVNFVHEVFRQAFLLSCHYSAAIKRVVLVYKDWIQINVQLPSFLLEPMEPTLSASPSDFRAQKLAHVEDSVDSTLRPLRARSEGPGAPGQSVRAGLQNTLQLFITNSANIFLLECSPEYQGHYLEDQVELCKRILNMYRYLVMNVYMSQRTWEQLLLVLLQVTTQTLSAEPAPKTREQTLGAILARPLFQTLIVTWVKANLNVTVTVELWDQFLAALSSLTAWEELIKEWAKTLETLTRVVARQVYDLDLNNLPLDRLTEQKSKRRRGTRANEQEGAGAWSRPVPPPESRDRTDSRRRSSLQAPEDSLSQHGSGGSQHGASPHPRKRYVSGAGPAGGGATAAAASAASGRLVRSLSEGSLAPSLLAVELAPPTAHRPYPLQEATRKVSRSMDSLRGRVSLYSQASEHDYHSRSPSPSSGLETNSIKESPMGLDLFGADGNSLDTVDSGTSEHRSVMSGGTLRGWLPDVAVVLWRRMLGALGNVNHIQSPGVHAQVFDFLIELSQSLIKIEDNLGISPDNQSTRWPSELVPPLPLLVPWCVEALRLPDSHQAGRLRALRLLCLLLVRRQPTPLPAAAGAQLLRALHRGLGSGNADVVHTLVRQCGAGFLSLELPASSLLVLDLIQACSAIAAAQELHGVPRTEAVSILGSLVCFPNRWPQLQALQPRPLEMNLTTCPDLKDRVVSVLLKCGKREPSVTARCTALVALAVYLYEELTHNTTHERMKDVIHILLSALKCNSRIVGQVASDTLVLLTDHAALLLANMPDVPRRIVEVTATTLETLMFAKPDPPPEERWLLVSLVFCLGEWCMKLPIDVLTEPDQQGKSLLLRVFKALSEGAPPCEKSSTDPQPTISLTVTDPNEQVLHVLVGDPPTSGSQSAGAELSDARDGSAARGGTVKLAARAVISHLVNHLDHFPMLSGAVRLGSLVSEHDDLPLMAARDELSSDVFYAPNVQFFVLNNRSLLSLVELPSLDVPGGGVTAGLCTAHSQVRVILRDLGGKFCWDASILYGTDAQLQTQETDVGRAASLPRPAPPPEQLMQHSKSEESLLSASLVAPPRFTVRHRGRGALPTWQDTEGDMDNLDDLLLYLGDTSPECTESEDAVSLLPSVLGQERHAEAITALLSQRSAELESARATDNSGPASACHPPAPQQAGSPFQHARLLFSQLGLSSWSRRPHIHLLRKSERLLRELRNVDNQKCRETHKIAVIYVALGQEDKRSILANSAGSQMFEEFVAGLAWEVELETHTGFMGGLQRNGTTGDTAPYYATSFTECLFHVSTRMPSHSEEALLQKTRHLGNDEVHVVWSEHKRDYRRGIIPTEFCDVLLVIYPLQSGLFRIQLSRKPEVPFFGPLFDGAIVGRKILPGLVRATALNASRAKRSMLPYYLNFFEERSQALETLISNHREASTFEELVGSVYSPAPPRPGAPSRTSTGGVSRETSDPAALATALVDCAHPPLGPRSSWLGDLRPRADTDSAMQEVDLGRADPSPKTLKRLSFKTTVRKASSSIQETIQSLPTAARSHLHGFQPATTPPDSPAQRPRK